MKAFYFHYNKPATQRYDKVTLSLHYDGACHLVSNINCNVPTMGRTRKTTPRFVMAGKANSFSIVSGVATIS